MNNKEFEEYCRPGKERFARFAAQWPDFFSDVSCGFSCPSEWETLLWTLCTNIEWRLLQADLPLDCLQVKQVKAKFGGLRFYYDLDTGNSPGVFEYVQGAIQLAESLSATGAYKL